ncbi:MAG: biotin--[acetyl-CoA-carboxylase] ligase [Candidatus Thermoplasmatota archaeon]|nr:biotin--[acetyl-CoA-carboxylase] ligase [Candidatus Thermoplasmatota archaeon]
MGDVISEGCLRGVGTGIIGRHLEIIDNVTSTNDIARERAKAGCREGLIIVARSQSDGKGRMGRNFHSPEGGLYLSIVLRPDAPPYLASTLPLLAGLAVSKSISTTLMLKTSLKWPNDVLIDGRKVSGILAESSIKGDRLEYVIIGIGINVNFPMTDLPQELWECAWTLRDASGSMVDMEELLRNLVCFLENLYNRFMEGDVGPILEEWSDRSETLGRLVRVRTPSSELEGTALGLDQTGALLISIDGLLHRIDSGDVEHLFGQ